MDNGLLDDLSHEVVTIFKNAVNLTQDKQYILHFICHLTEYTVECKSNDKAASGADKFMKNAKAYNKFLQKHELPCEITSDLATLLSRIWFLKANSAWRQPPVAPPVPVMSLSETNAARTA